MPKKGLQKAMKMRLSADQQEALDRLADRAGLHATTFARQVLHYFIVGNDEIYAKLFPGVSNEEIYAKLLPKESQKVAPAQERAKALTRRNTMTNL